MTSEATTAARTWHTPGPWHVEPFEWDQGASLAICNKTHGVLALIPPLDEAEGEAGALRDPCDEANARLLAAAPGLLEALAALATAADDLDAALDGVTEQFRGECAALRAAGCTARAALAVASGG